MNRTEITALAILGAMGSIGFILWVLLGGLDESGRWPVPDGAVFFLDLVAKGTFGSFLTIVTQAVRNQYPIYSTPLTSDEQPGDAKNGKAQP